MFTLTDANDYPITANRTHFANRCFIRSGHQPLMCFVSSKFHDIKK